MSFTTEQKERLEQLVQKAVRQNTPEELALGWLRYETLRKANPRKFSEFHEENLKGAAFDDIITRETLKPQ